MRLYILGKHSDDKGFQLERLTTRILEHQGFVNLSTNVQVAGASELDVTGKKIEIAGVKSIEWPVLCECKAHEKPITMNDWLKFIGKLYIERKTRPNTIGLMLALSGANGNVLGSYENDFADDSSIQLIANDNLISLIKEIYSLPEVTAIKKNIRGFVSMDISEINPIYYQDNIWWLIGFSNRKFTLCYKDSRPVTLAESQEILDLLPSVTEFQIQDFIDLYQALQTNQLIEEIETLILAFVVQKAKCSLDSLYAEIANIMKGNRFEKFHFKIAVDKNPFLERDETHIYLKEKIDMIKFYRYIFQKKKITPNLIVSDFYQNHINKNLLQEIWTIQDEFRVEEEQEDKVIQILKMSPSALYYVLSPNPILKNYNTIKSDKEMCRMHNSFFMNSLINNFLNDFQKPFMGDVYYNYFKVKVLHKNSLLAVDFKDGNSVEIDSNINLAFMELGGSIAGVIIKDNIDLSL